MYWDYNNELFQTKHTHIAINNTFEITEFAVSTSRVEKLKIKAKG